MEVGRQQRGEGVRAGCACTWQQPTSTYKNGTRWEGWPQLQASKSGAASRPTWDTTPPPPHPPPLAAAHLVHLHARLIVVVAEPDHHHAVLLLQAGAPEAVSTSRAPLARPARHPPSHGAPAVASHRQDGLVHGKAAVQVGQQVGHRAEPPLAPCSCCPGMCDRCPGGWAAGRHRCRSLGPRATALCSEQTCRQAGLEQMCW